MFQDALVYLLVAGAAAFLVWNFFLRKKKKRKGADCDDCH